jgi:hypothetical protein
VKGVVDPPITNLSGVSFVLLERILPHSKYIKQNHMTRDRDQYSFGPEEQFEIGQSSFLSSYFLQTLCEKINRQSLLLAISPFLSFQCAS